MCTTTTCTNKLWYWVLLVQLELPHNSFLKIQHAPKFMTLKHVHKHITWQSLLIPKQVRNLLSIYFFRQQFKKSHYCWVNLRVNAHLMLILSYFVAYIHFFHPFIQWIRCLLWRWEKIILMITHVQLDRWTSSSPIPNQPQILKLIPNPSVNSNPQSPIPISDPNPQS